MTAETLPTESDTAQEAELVAQVRRGDPTSCAAFVAHFGAPVCNYLYWLTGKADEAAAVFKDTVLYLYLNPGRVRKESSVRDWVYRYATQTWLQSQQRKGQGRSSLDKILRGGLKKAENAPWEDWQRRCNLEVGASDDAVASVVERLGDLSDQERAGLLLTVIAGLSENAAAATLRFSPRKARGRIAQAFGRLALGVSGPPEPSTRKTRSLVCRRVLALETPRQAKKLDGLLAAAPDSQQFIDEGEAVLSLLRNIPPALAPEGLAEDTAAHLSEGHAALETRIATWGFRFMLLTVPLFILAILVIILFPAINRSREMARRAAASENLRVLGKAFQGYSDASYGNRYPPLTSREDLWVPDLEGLYPTYIKDPALLVSPSLNDPALVASMTEALNQSPPDWDKAHEILARSYVYTGYALLDGQAMTAFSELRNSGRVIDLEGDVETDTRRFFRLRQGVEQLFAGNVHLDAEEGAIGELRIPVMFEVFTATGFAGNPEGANVLYLDGTVDYVSFGSAFPVDAAVLAVLEN